MAHDVFVSHSSKENAIANEICALLEANGISCWIAPRDIAPGQTWAGAIFRAINASRVLVLVFSESSNHSHQVLREVRIAVEKELPILAFRLENVPLSDDLNYFIGTNHWIIAALPVAETHLQTLESAVKDLLKIPKAPPAKPPVETPVKSAPVEKATSLDDLDPYDLDAMIITVRRIFSDDQKRDTEQALRDLTECLEASVMWPDVQNVNFEQVLQEAVRRRVLCYERQVYLMDAWSIEDYALAECIEVLGIVIGQEWCQREDAMREAANYLGFSKLGSRIRATFASAFRSGLLRKVFEAQGDVIRCRPASS
ncbi:MAG TPA: toll/interleukin-1 receptor domain-containing protein [Abditibacteriaceae bacterium]|jgi:hypothetical protein